jgi:hypothetical protein
MLRVMEFSLGVSGRETVKEPSVGEKAFHCGSLAHPEIKRLKRTKQNNAERKLLYMMVPPVSSDT